MLGRVQVANGRNVVTRPAQAAALFLGLAAAMLADDEDLATDDDRRQRAHGARDARRGGLQQGREGLICFRNRYFGHEPPFLKWERRHVGLTARRVPSLCREAAGIGPETMPALVPLWMELRGIKARSGGGTKVGRNENAARGLFLRGRLPIAQTPGSAPATRRICKAPPRSRRPPTPQLVPALSDRSGVVTDHTPYRRHL